MSFSQTVDMFVKHLDKAPKAPVAEARVEARAEKPGRKLQLPKVKGLDNPKVMQALEKAQMLGTPRSITPDQHSKHMKKTSAFRKGTLEAFKTLSAEDKRKLSAIAKAGISGGKVLDQYRFQLPGASTWSMASAAHIQKGLDQAKAEGLDLDGSWDAAPVGGKSSGATPDFFKTFKTA